MTITSIKVHFYNKHSLYWRITDDTLKLLEQYNFNSHHSTHITTAQDLQLSLFSSHSHKFLSPGLVHLTIFNYFISSNINSCHMSHLISHQITCPISLQNIESFQLSNLTSNYLTSFNPQGWHRIISFQPYHLTSH